MYVIEFLQYFKYIENFFFKQILSYNSVGTRLDVRELFEFNLIFPTLNFQKRICKRQKSKLKVVFYGSTNYTNIIHIYECLHIKVVL